jgi:hypothetical protein
MSPLGAIAMLTGGPKIEFSRCSVASSLGIAGVLMP